MNPEIWKIDLDSELHFRLANEITNQWTRQYNCPIHSENWAEWMKISIITSINHLCLDQKENNYQDIILGGISRAINNLERKILSTTMMSFLEDLLLNCGAELVSLFFSVKNERKTDFNGDLQKQIISKIQDPMFAQKNESFWIRKNWPLLLQQVVECVQGATIADQMVGFSLLSSLSDRSKSWSEYAPAVYLSIFPNCKTKPPAQLSAPIQAPKILLISPKIKEEQKIEQKIEQKAKIKKQKQASCCIIS